MPGRALAEVARRRFLGQDARNRRVVVMAGPGGNGGGALVAARRLHGYGSQVEVLLSHPVGDFADVPLDQLTIARRAGLTISDSSTVSGSGEEDLIIDGILGYSLRGNPRRGAAELIDWAHGRRAPLLSLDVPSGLDASTGEASKPVIRATATLTLALPKQGLRRYPELVGDLFLADIGVPLRLYREMGLEVGPIFALGDTVQLTNR